MIFISFNFNHANFFLPSASCDKVMFLHLSVSHSVQRGRGFCLWSLGRHPAGQTPHWADTPLGRHPLGRHSPRADTPQADLPGQTPPWADISLGRHPLPSACWDTHTPCPPAQCVLGYGQQAGDTHPTGMHSCFIRSFVSNSNKSRPM